MAESRIVPCNLLSWPAIENLLPDQKLIFIYLWMNRFTKACGCYALPIQLAAVELSVSTASLREALSDFVQKGLIHFDEETNELYVTAWARFHKFKTKAQIHMYWISVKQIESQRLYKLVGEKSQTNALLKGYDPSRGSLSFVDKNQKLEKSTTCALTETVTPTITKSLRTRGNKPPPELLALREKFQLNTGKKEM